MKKKLSDGGFRSGSRFGKSLFCTTSEAEPRRKRRRRRRLFVESLEGRITPAQLVDVGGLRFEADSFSTTDAGYKASGATVLIGFTPSGAGEYFRGLLSVDLNSASDPEELEIDTADLTFTLSGGAIDLVSQGDDRRAWQSQLAQTFSMLALTGATGAALDADDALPFDAASFDFTANNLQLINPNGGDTSDSESRVRGVFDFNSALGDATTQLPGVPVAGDDYVAVRPDTKPTPNGDRFSAPDSSGSIKSLAVEGGVVATYQTDGDGNDLWSFSGNVLLSSRPQDHSQTAAFESLPAALDLTLKNAAFERLEFGVTESFTLFVASLKTSNDNPLRFAYDFAEDQYEWSGGLVLSVDGNSIDVKLGLADDPTLPGVVIRQGVVETVNAMVSTEFSFFGVKFQTTPGGVTLQYDRGSEQYVMFGGMELIDPVAEESIFTLQMGTSAADAGLLIQNGNLKQIEAAVTSNAFKAGPLTWRVSSAGFKWTQDSHGRDIFIVFGDFLVEEVWQIDVTLGDGVAGDNSGMKLSSDGFELDGFRIELQNLNVGFLTLEDFTVAYQKEATTGDYIIDLNGLVYFPESASKFDAAMTFDAEKAAITAFSFGMALGNQPFALGSTGLFVTAFNVDVENPNSSSSFQITGDVALIYGDQLKLAGQNVTIIAGVGEVTITKDEMLLQADVYWGAQQQGEPDPNTLMPQYKGTLGTGSGVFTLDWANNHYSLDASAKLFQGAFEVDGSFTFDGTNKNYFIYFEASAAVKVPKSIPFIGGQDLADFHFVFDYHSKDAVTGEPIGYVAAWTTLNFLVTKKEVGFLFDINDSGATNPRSVGKHAIDEIKDGDYAPSTKVYTYSKAFQVPTGANVAEFQVQWALPKGSQTVAYEFVPAGGSHSNDNIIPQSDFGNGNHATLIANSTDAPTNTLLTQLSDPEVETAGTYYYYLYSTEKFSDDQLDWQFTYSIPDPVVSLASDLPAGLYTNPAIGVDVFHSVGTGLASQATVTLYADTDRQGYDGFKVNSFVPTSDVSTYEQLQWRLTNLPIDEYFVYASINDGVNPTAYSAYSTQAEFLPTGPISGYVLDNVNFNVGVPSVQVYLDANDDGAFDPSTEPSWTTNGFGYYRFDYEDVANTVRLQNGRSYQVGLVEVEGMALIENGALNPRPITSPDVIGADTTFELQINSSIAGTVFNDANQNGMFTSGEKVAGGWTVYIDANTNGALDITDPSAVTTTDGAYRIFNLEPSTTYTLRLHQDPGTQSNFFHTSPTSLGVTTGPGAYELVSGKNFGVLEYATISGKVDNYALEGDGSLSGEASPPPAGWEVQLLNTSGAVIATATASTTDGGYRFDNVIPGDYKLHQIVQPGWLQVAPVTADTPSFTHAFVSLGAAPVDMAVADFDLDGDLDLATVTASSASGTVTFFLNDGKGDFAKDISRSVTFSSGEAYALAVIEGWPNTSAPSLAVVSKHGWVSVLTNLSKHGSGLAFGTINSCVKFLHADEMKGVTAGDFNEDGVTDLAGSYNAQSGDDDRFSVLLMKTATQVDGKHFDHPGQLAAADMNHDGHLDLVLNSGDNETNFNIAYGDGTGDFTKRVTTWFLNGGESSLSLKSDGRPVAISDVNADGLLDVIFGASDNPGMVIHTQNSLGGFFFLRWYSADMVDLGVDRIQGGLYPNPVILSGAGELDVFYDITEPSVLTRLSEVETPSVLRIIDVNADGLPDMLAGDAAKGGIWLYHNQTSRDVDVSLTLAAGELAADVDFTNDETAQITGAVYDDANLSGTQEGFEGGLADVRVFLDKNRNGQWDRGERFTYTNAHGAFAFHHLPAKSHVIAVEAPAGRIHTNPLAGLREIVIDRGRGGREPQHVLNFALAPGVQVERYSDSVNAGLAWTLRRSGAYLELVDDAEGVVLQRRQLREMHSVALYTSNFAPDAVTIDFTFGGAFALPGGVYVDGGRDGLSGGSRLRFVGDRTDRVTHISETQAVINGELVLTWTNNLAEVVFETDGAIFGSMVNRRTGAKDLRSSPFLGSPSKAPSIGPPEIPVSNVLHEKFHAEKRVLDRMAAGWFLSRSADSHELKEDKDIVGGGADRDWFFAGYGEEPAGFDDDAFWEF